MEFNDNFIQVAEQWKKKPQQFLNAIKIGMHRGIREYESKVINDQLSGRKTQHYGLNKISGNASHSLNVVTNIEGNDVVGKLTVGKGAWYLKLHQHYQFNGYARAKGGTSFVVPVHPKAKGHSPRDFNLVLIKRPGKNPILVNQIKRKGSDRIRREDIMYVLTKTIKIPKRLYIFEEFKYYGRQMIEKQIMIELQKAKEL